MISSKQEKNLQRPRSHENKRPNMRQRDTKNMSKMIVNVYLGTEVVDVNNFIFEVYLWSSKSEPLREWDPPLVCFTAQMPVTAGMGQLEARDSECCVGLSCRWQGTKPLNHHLLPSEAQGESKIKYRSQDFEQVSSKWCRHSK